ncbi:MAG: hypothetical protein E6J69_15940 [Deltaproteobacteria bacterium]|nr:MAG: hypothetical protein E6J69_15940 [Deltaproteobacteria bacterium]
MRPSSRVLLAGLLAVVSLVAFRVPAHAWCVGGAPPALDEDNDGLNDIQERFFGTDPNNPDTNGNGILDGDEDADGDGIPNKDEPTIFSLEGFVDPFAARTHNIALVIEGTNLFPHFVGSINRINFVQTRQLVWNSQRRKLNKRVRIYLRMSWSRAQKLAGKLEVETALGDTNFLSFQRMNCPGGPPQVMAAALVNLNTRLKGTTYHLSYVAIGGCNLIDREGKRARTRVRLADHDILLRVPYGGIQMLPTRVMIPAHGAAKPDPIYPYSDNINVGDTLSIVTDDGESNAVTVDPPIADLRIPTEDLGEDHDQDGRTVRRRRVVPAPPRTTGRVSRPRPWLSLARRAARFFHGHRASGPVQSARSDRGPGR